MHQGFNWQCWCYHFSLAPSWCDCSYSEEGRCGFFTCMQIVHTQRTWSARQRGQPKPARPRYRWVRIVGWQLPVLPPFLTQICKYTHRVGVWNLVICFKKNGNFIATILLIHFQFWWHHQGNSQNKWLAERLTLPFFLWPQGCLMLNHTWHNWLQNSTT